MTDRPGYSFNPGPPPEASRFLKNKGLRPAFSWLDVEPEEHAVAFTVAKAMQIDVLTAIREEVQRAIDEGVPLAQFQKNLRPRLEKLGWWGRAERVDPLTGEAQEVQLGSPRRLRTIYNANLRSARAAGQWERIERTKKALPYLEYRLGPSERHRPHHEDKAGLVLPVNDPFWDEWMPPNGWGCKCWVRQITRAEAERRGISRAPHVPDRKWTNQRTGEVQIVPQGIDPGWQRNPGKLRMQALEGVLNGKLDALPYAVARTAARDIATSWRAERVLRGEAPGAVAVAILPADIAEAVGSGAHVVQMTSSYGEKFISRDREVTVETLLVLDEALRDGQIAIEVANGVRSLIVQSRGEKPWRFVIKLLPEGGGVWVRTVHRSLPRKWRALLKRPDVTILKD